MQIHAVGLRTEALERRLVVDERNDYLIVHSRRLLPHDDKVAVVYPD